MTYQTGFETTIAFRVEPTDTTIKLATAPTATNGRIYIFNNAQEEWVSYTGVSGTTITWVTRWLSKTADPATAWTGLTWIAWTTVRLVAMHDQMPDKKDSNTFGGKQTFNEVDFDSTWKFSPPIYATTTARDAEITSPTNGLIVYVTADWLFYKYEAGAWSSFASWSVPNATTTTSWKVEIATQAELEAWTDTGWTWASIVATPWQINPKNITKKVITASDYFSYSDSEDSWNLKADLISSLLSLVATWFFGDWSDWDVTLTTGTTTLTRDMYYNNLTINSPAILNPNGYRIFVKWTISGDWKVQRNWNNWSVWGNWLIGTAATWWAAATTLNQGSLFSEPTAWGWGWSHSTWWTWWGTNPWMTFNHWVGWGEWGASAFFPQFNQWAAWPWWASVQWPNYNRVFPSLLIHPATTANTNRIGNYGNCWSAWWGGWWATVNTWSFEYGWWGWWGWWQWWMIRFSCRVWNFTWIVESKWGNGWNWWNATWWSRWGWGGGWGWWNWWTVLRIYNVLQNNCTFTLTPWVWWTWWTGNSAGSNWLSGSAWVNIDIQI